MLSCIEQFYVEAEPLIARFQAWFPSGDLSARIDHLCFKCANTPEYEYIRALFEPTALFVYQSIIAGRRIAIIKLPKPIVTSAGEIWFLELSDQKPDGSQRSGFEHVELYPTHGSLAELVARFEARGIAFEKTVRPHHTTYDLTIESGFKVGLEDEPLVETIKREEMK